MINKEILIDIINSGTQMGRNYIAEKYGITESDARKYVAILESFDVVKDIIQNDKELVIENIKYKKQTQKLNDINRIERKSFREVSRIENAVVEYGNELLKIFDEFSLTIKTVEHNVKSKTVGVIQISDTHFNELVELDFNKYDFVIASKRVQKYIDKAKHYFKTKGVDTVLFCLTGDLLNSDRRLDELVSKATNRSKATFLAVEILLNSIIDLNKDFNVNVTSVIGNESRVNKEMGWTHEVASDSYDLTIYLALERILRGHKGINFLGGDKLQNVVNVNGHNWVIIHGHQSEFNTSPTKAVSKLVRLYADKGIIIRYVIFGHIHEACIADLYSRCSSLVGANAYSEDGLLLTSRASQNIHIAYDNGDIDSIKVGLQNTDDYDGYEIQEQLKAYNAKSATKLNTHTKILEIII